MPKVSQVIEECTSGFGGLEALVYYPMVELCTAKAVFSSRIAAVTIDLPSTSGHLAGNVYSAQIHTENILHSP
jgi:hypothetical protein